MRHLALGATLAPLGWWDRVKAFPGYLGFFKKKNIPSGPPPGGPYTLYSWGPEVQFLGYPNAWLSPLQIGTATNWSSLVSSVASYGVTYIFGVKTDGTLWAWGTNKSGQLGLSDLVNRSLPTQVGSLTNWARVTASDGQSILAVKTNGTLWAWGNNGYGVLGDALPSRSSPTQIGALTNWSKVSTASSYYGSNGYTAAIKTDGTLWTWGLGGPLLGRGAAVSASSPVQVGALTNWSTISCARMFAASIKTNGTLWTWGYNYDGELGDGTVVSKSSPVQVGAATNWAKVSTSDNFAVALKTDGTIWAWGYNYYGQLGLGHTTSQSTPAQIGNLTTWTDIEALQGLVIAKKSDGTLWQWGTSPYFGWGRNGTSSPVQVGAGTTWSKLAQGFTGALTNDNKAWMWNITQTKLGAFACNWPELSPVQVGATNEWSDLRAAGSFGLGIKTNGTLWIWGSNTAGQLGTGDITLRYSPVQVGSATNWLKAADCYGSTSGAIKSDGTLWMWGYNAAGAVGDGTNLSRSSPVQVGGSWQQVVVRSQTAAGIKSDGTLWTWGAYDGYVYYTDDGDYDDGDGPYENISYYYVSSPVQVGTSQWSSIATGDYPDCVLAIKSDGTLWGWGGNYQNLIPMGDPYYTPISSLSMISAASWRKVSASNHAMGIQTNGTLWGWGNNYAGQIGVGTSQNSLNSPVQVGTDTNWVDVHCGSAHTIAVKSDGTLWAWGDNSNLQLGNNTFINASSPVQIGTAANWKGVVGSTLGLYILK